MAISLLRVCLRLDRRGRMPILPRSKGNSCKPCDHEDPFLPKRTSGIASHVVYFILSVVTTGIGLLPGAKAVNQLVIPFK